MGQLTSAKLNLWQKTFYNQKADYQETFSPIVKAETIRIVLNLAVMNNWKLREVDINNAFLNRELNEAVYIHLPKGFDDSSHPKYVCNFKKDPLRIKTSTKSLV